MNIGRAAGNIDRLDPQAVFGKEAAVLGDMHEARLQTDRALADTQSVLRLGRAAKMTSNKQHRKKKQCFHSVLLT